MCKHSFGTQQVHPWMLCEIIPDFEGQKHVYTELSISSIWPYWIISSVKVKSLSDRNALEFLISNAQSSGAR